MPLSEPEASHPESSSTHRVISSVIPVARPEPEHEVSQISVVGTSDDVSKNAGEIKTNAENEWHALLPQLKLGGMTRQLAEHCLLESIEDEQVTLLLDAEGSNLQTPRTEEPLVEALCLHLGRKVRLVFKVGAMQAETPDQRRLRVSRELQERMEQVIEQDSFVRQLKERFGALIVPGSIRQHTDQ